MHLAVSLHDNELTKMLLEKDLDLIHVKDNHKITPFTLLQEQLNSYIYHGREVGIIPLLNEFLKILPLEIKTTLINQISSDVIDSIFANAPTIRDDICITLMRHQYKLILKTTDGTSIDKICIESQDIQLFNKLYRIYDDSQKIDFAAQFLKQTISDLQKPVILFLYKVVDTNNFYKRMGELL